MLLQCSRCGKVVIVNVFMTGINTVSFSLVLSCDLGVFNSAVAAPDTGSSGLARVFDYELCCRT